MKHCLSSIIALSCFVFAGAAQAAAINVDAITTEPLHVRGGPSKHARVHDILPPEFPLIVGNCTRAWCQVYYEGKNGWTFMPALAFREGTSFYNDPNLGPFYGRAKYKRGQLYQTAYLTPQQEQAAGRGFGDSAFGSAFGRLKGMASGFGKTALMMTPAGGAITAADTVRSGVSRVRTTAGSLASKSSAAAGGLKRRGPLKRTGRLSHGQISNLASAAQNGINSAANGKDMRTGWWTNYQRPSIQNAVQPRWWQKKK